LHVLPARLRAFDGSRWIVDCSESPLEAVMSKVLVVYFSRSGHTRSAAESIARALDADLEEITEARSRSGIRGWLRSGFEATFRRAARIHQPRRDPSSYDLVVIGSPTWSASVSSPVRAFLSRNAGRIAKIAVLCTCGGHGGQRVVRQIEHLAGRSAVAEAIVTDADRATGADVWKVNRFIAELRGLVPAAAASAVA
jgi:flavodoxin